MPLIPVNHSLEDLKAAAAELDFLRTKADENEQASLAPSTRRYYESDWRQFVAWCARHDLRPLPARPETVRLYITDMAIQVLPGGEHRFKPSTIERHLASISRKHYDRGYGRGMSRHEVVGNAMAGIRRTRVNTVTRAMPLLLDDVKSVLAAADHTTWPSGVLAARDTLAIGLGFAAAMRRSEVAALNVSDVIVQPLDGLHVRIIKSKTDQESQGVTLGVPWGSTPQTCIPCAYVRWLRLLVASRVNGGRGDRVSMMRDVLGTGTYDAWAHICRSALPQVPADLQAAPLLRPLGKGGRIADRPITPDALHLALKKRLVAAGYNSDKYGFHSLRAGFVTQARRNGADPRAVRLQTRHQSDAMVDVYDREWLPLADGNAVWKIGL